MRRRERRSPSRGDGAATPAVASGRHTGEARTANHRNSLDEEDDWDWESDGGYPGDGGDDGEDDQIAAEYLRAPEQPGA